MKEIPRTQACLGCGQTDQLVSLPNIDPTTGNVTGNVNACPDCRCELSERPALAQLGSSQVTH